MSDTSESGSAASVPPVTAEALNGRGIAVVLTTDESSCVMSGTEKAMKEGVIVHVDSGGWLPISEDAMVRVRAVTEEDRADTGLVRIFEDAAFWVRLFVGNVTDDEAAAQRMLGTGVKLPGSDANGA